MARDCSRLLIFSECVAVSAHKVVFVNRSVCRSRLDSPVA
jgi:hypothetical protein